MLVAALVILTVDPISSGVFDWVLFLGLWKFEKGEWK